MSLKLTSSSLRRYNHEVRGYHQVSLIKPTLYSAAPCTPLLWYKSISQATSPGWRRRCQSVPLQCLKGHSVPAVLAKCSLSGAAEVYTDPHKCLSTPCSNAGGHSRSYHCQQQRQSLGTALVARCASLLGNLRSEVLRCSEICHQSTQWPPLTTRCSPGGRGCSWSQVKGAGKKLYRPGTNGIFFFCKKSVKRCCQIQKHVENAHVWEAELGLERCPWCLGMPIWSTDPSSSQQQHWELECAAAWEELSTTEQDRERSSSPIYLCPAFPDQQKPQQFPGLFASECILVFCNSSFQK